jgi:hypothetical protein
MVDENSRSRCVVHHPSNVAHRAPGKIFAKGARSRVL